jgi:acetoin utilization deacetylase AcuC-like enzyme
MSDPGSEALAIVDDERFDEHHERTGRHPECPERLVAAREGLYDAVPQTRRTTIAAREATAEEIARVHAANYWPRIEERLAAGYGQVDPDTYFAPGTAVAARLAAGSAAEIALALLRPAGPRRGIALLRPPGHHAEPNSAMGFCLINNVAVATASALDAGARRVAIVDWDVHHGNGTQAAFYGDPRVLFVSLHQHPFYPGSGEPEEIGSGAGRGYTANVALPAGQGPESYAHAFRHLVLPLLERFAADLVLVSAGFDAHRRDPLAQMHLDAQSYAAMAGSLVDHVERVGHGRVALLLEGGYDLRALHESVAGSARALLGERIALSEDAAPEAARAAVARTRRALEPYWQLEHRSV